MIRIMMMVLLLSCGQMKGEDGSAGQAGQNGLNGVDGSDGLNYYSYIIQGSVQEIVNDGVREQFETSQGDVYGTLEDMELMVDNIYPDCDLQDVDIVVETDTNQHVYTFQASENRYYMQIKSQPAPIKLDTSVLKVYYRSEPETDCGNAIYRLHSGLTFSIRVFEQIELEE